jgi:AcrR family transcriptional regulator
MVTQDERSQSTREALIQAGLALFAERGYNGVSVSEIAERAGVTTGALYHQFASKENLFKAVHTDVVQSLSARIVKARELAGKPSLITDCEVYLDACVDPAFHRVVLVDGPAVIDPGLVLDIGQLMIEGSLAAARERGEIADPPLEPLARMLAAAMKEAGVMIGSSPDSAKVREETRAGVRRLIGGLLTKRA